MVHVTLKEIESAFKSHRNKFATFSGQPGMTDKMILFYAVECGLKALYMRQNKLIRTDRKSSYNGKAVSDFGHKLNDLLKTIKLNYSIPKITANDSSQIEQLHLHEAWRYGKSLDEKQEKNCIEILNKVLKEIRNQLGR
jgi:hypothetical protein